MSVDDRKLQERLDEIERLLGVVSLEGLPRPVAVAIERAYAQSRHDWPEYVELVERSIAGVG